MTTLGPGRGVNLADLAAELLETLVVPVAPGSFNNLMLLLLVVYHVHIVLLGLFSSLLYGEFTWLARD